MAKATQKDLKGATFEKLSIYLIEQMSKDHISGHIVDKSWARNKVADFFRWIFHEKYKLIVGVDRGIYRESSGVDRPKTSPYLKELQKRLGQNQGFSGV